MSETTEKSKSSKLSLSRPGKLELKKTVESGAVRQNFSHGRSKMVQVERKTKRTFALDSGGRMAEVKARKTAEAFEEVIEEVAVEAPPSLPPSVDEEKSTRTLTEEEKAARQRALEEAKKYEDERKEAAERDAARREAVRAAAEAEVATEDEVKTAEEAVAAGAIGLSSSRVSIHRDASGVLLPGSLAAHKELLEMGKGIADGGGGVFELASSWNLYDDFVREGNPDPQKLREYGSKEWDWLHAMATIPGGARAARLLEARGDVDVEHIQLQQSSQAGP